MSINDAFMTVPTSTGLKQNHRHLSMNIFKSNDIERESKLKISTLGKFAACLVSSMAFFAGNADLSGSPAFADSRLDAPTSAGTRVNSDAESLLRYGLPITNKEIRDIQSSVESAKLNLKTRRIQYAKGDVENVKAMLSKYESKLLNAVPSVNLAEAKSALESMKADVPPLLASISAESAAGAGSLQERKGVAIYFLLVIYDTEKP
jgi:hypothetical protein